jgi:drug/metabolite transporter (DMT)-like permease
MTERRALVTGALSISVAATMWGLDGVVLTPRLYNLDVGYVVFILHILPFLIMQAFLYRQWKYLKNFTGKDYLVFLLIALFGGAIGTMSIVKALFLVNFKELSIVVLLQKLQPVFAISLAAILLKERLNKYFMVWASIAILGGYFLTFGLHLPNFQTGSNTTIAAMFALLAAFSFGSSTVFSKIILNRYDFKTATFYRYGFTSLLMFIFVFASGRHFQFMQTTELNWLIFLIIAFTTGSGAIFLYYHGLKNVKAILSIMFELFFPISTIFFDYVFNGHKLTLVQWVSAIVMIFAIINLNRSHYGSPKAEEKPSN